MINNTHKELRSKITILGCGSSAGVPSLEYIMGRRAGTMCDVNNPKNSRTRSSILVEIDGFSILVDTSPDFRQQMLNNKVKRIDSILYTHHHIDHTAGVYDIRSYNRLQKEVIDCYLNQETYDLSKGVFALPFKDPSDVLANNSFYRPCLTPHIIENNSCIWLNNKQIEVKALLHPHGSTNTLGYKFNNKFAYITDISAMSEELIKEYQNLEVIIISACLVYPHPAHLEFEVIIDLIKNTLRPKKGAFLTHMSDAIDYGVESPKYQEHNIFLCYDGLVINL